MAHYRIYFLKPNNRIGRAANVGCETDEIAVTAAVAMRQNGSAVEIWQGARFVCELPADCLHPELLRLGVR